MPKISEERLAARREQVLQAAWSCFARNGFHATTMADVIAESEMSAGGVYRYFRSKEEIVTAIADRAYGTLTTALQDLLADPDVTDVADVVGRLLRTVEEFADGESFDRTRIVLLAWAESLRSAEIGAKARSIQLALRELLVQVVARAQAAGQMRADADPAAVAPVIASVLIGYVVQRLVVGGMDPAFYTAGVQGLVGAHR